MRRAAAFAAKVFDRSQPRPPEKIVLYTAITGDFDPLPVIVPEPGVEYWLFTDNPDMETPSFWNRSLLANPESLPPRRLSRLPKLRPHLFLPPHTISIYIDATTEMLQPVAAFARDCVRKRPLAVHAHPVRKCLYAEAEKCLRKGLDDASVVARQMERYRAAGFPKNFGLTENRFIVRRNVEQAIRFNEHWHREYLLGSQRDQLCFMYSVWSTGIRLRVIPQNARQNAYYRIRPHLGNATR